MLLVLGIVTLGWGLIYAGRTTYISPLWSVALICRAGGLLAALIPILWAQSSHDEDSRALAKVYHGDVDAVLITDTRGQLEHANPYAQALLRLLVRHGDMFHTRRVKNRRTRIGRGCGLQCGCAHFWPTEQHQFLSKKQ